MKILRATHLGMCFGVRDAIALALSRSKTQPVTVLGDLVHNESVLKTLRDQGVKIEHQVASVATTDVMKPHTALRSEPCTNCASAA